jgi:diguanylate cyclase (GGDEF)-like protein
MLLAAIAAGAAQLVSEILPLQHAIEVNAAMAERAHLLLAGSTAPPAEPRPVDTDTVLSARLGVIEQERAAGRLPADDVLRAFISDLAAERDTLASRIDASRGRMGALGGGAFTAAMAATLALVHANRRRMALHQERAALLLGATHDPDTGIYNRSAILDALCREAARSRRSEAPVGVAIVELAPANPVADGAACDAVIAESARRLRAGVRVYDAVGRFDEQRFLLVLPGCGAEGARALADRLARDVQAAVDRGGVRARVLVGVAAAQSGEDPLAAVARAGGRSASPGAA